MQPSMNRNQNVRRGHGRSFSASGAEGVRGRPSADARHLVQTNASVVVPVSQMHSQQWLCVGPQDDRETAAAVRSAAGSSPSSLLKWGYALVGGLRRSRTNQPSERPHAAPATHASSQTLGSRTQWLSPRSRSSHDRDDAASADARAPSPNKSVSANSSGGIPISSRSSSLRGTPMCTLSNASQQRQMHSAPISVPPRRWAPAAGSGSAIDSVNGSVSSASTSTHASVFGLFPRPAASAHGGGRALQRPPTLYEEDEEHSEDDCDSFVQNRFQYSSSWSSSHVADDASLQHLRHRRPHLHANRDDFVALNGHTTVLDMMAMLVVDDDGKTKKL